MHSDSPSLSHREKEEQVRLLEKHLEDMGVSLYVNQQLLSEQQLNISKIEGILESSRMRGAESDDELAKAEATLDSITRDQAAKDSTLNTLRSELLSLNESMRDVERYNDSVSSAAAVHKRSALKTEGLISELEKEKFVQDRELLILESECERLNSEISAMTEVIAIRQAEKSASIDLIKDAVDSLAQLEAERKLIRSEISAMASVSARREMAVAESIKAIQSTKAQKLEVDVDIKITTGHLVLETAKFDQLLTEWFEKGEVVRDELNRQIEKNGSLKEGMVAEFGELRRQVQETRNETDAVKAEQVNEARTQAALQRDVRVVQTQLSAKKDEVLALIAEKNCLNISLVDSIRENKKLRKHEHDRQTELSKVSSEASKLRADREQLEKATEALQDQLAAAEAELAAKEAEVAKLENENGKTRKDILIKSRISEKMKAKIDNKIIRIKEAELSDRSSELSLSLGGKAAGLEREIAKIMAQCDQMEQQWLARQGELLELGQVVEEDRVKVDSLRGRIQVLDKAKRRKLLHAESAKTEIKRHKAEVLKLKFDLDKLGVLIGRFDSKLDAVRELVREKRDGVGVQRGSHGDKVAELNTQLESEIRDLEIEAEIVDRQWNLLTQKLEIEQEIQATLTQSGSDGGFDRAATERAINRMKTELGQLNRRKDQMNKALVQLVEKRDVIELKFDRNARSRNASKAGLSSCSTVASLGSLGGVERQVESVNGRIEQVIKMEAEVEIRLQQVTEERAKIEHAIEDTKNFMQRSEIETTKLTTDLAAIRVHVAFLTTATDRLSEIVECVKDGVAGGAAIKGERDLLMNELNRWDKTLREVGESSSVVSQLRNWVDFELQLILSV